MILKDDQKMYAVLRKLQCKKDEIPLHFIAQYTALYINKKSV